MTERYFDPCKDNFSPNSKKIFDKIVTFLVSLKLPFTLTGYFFLKKSPLQEGWC